MKFIKVTKYDSYRNKLDSCYVNKDSIHCLKHSSIDATKDIIKLGVTSSFELIDLIYNNNPADTIIVSSLEDFADMISE